MTRSFKLWLPTLALALTGTACSHHHDMDDQAVIESRQTDPTTVKAKKTAKHAAVRHHGTVGASGARTAGKKKAAAGADAAVENEQKAAQKPVDDTGRNTRDRNDDRLTAADQSNKRSDVEITAAIRKGVVKRDDLSTDAKNVKIITRDGHVTLRGPVASPQEKEFIDATARSTAGVTGVTDQLEVLAH